MSTFLPQDTNDNPIPVLRLKDGGAHNFATTSGSARNATAFNGDTRVVSIYATSPVYLAFGDVGVTAGTSDHYFPAGVYYDFAIGGGQSGHNTHIAARAVGADGVVYMSEKD